MAKNESKEKPATKKDGPIPVIGNVSGKVWVDFTIEEITKNLKMDVSKVTGGTVAKFVREKFGIERVGSRVSDPTMKLLREAKKSNVAVYNKVKKQLEDAGIELPEEE